MIILHNQKGAIIGQVLKEIWREDVVLLASNINQTAGGQWQSILKFRDTKQSFPAVYGFALCLHDAFEKDSPYAIELSEVEARGKLKSWGMAGSEIEKLLNSKMEVE